MDHRLPAVVMSAFIDFNPDQFVNIFLQIDFSLKFARFSQKTKIVVLTEFSKFELQAVGGY